jgi:hypothetical protein
MKSNPQQAFDDVCFCMFEMFALFPPNVCSLNPTPPTLQHRGVFLGHPFSAHTHVEQWIESLFRIDHVQRVAHDQLSCLCTTYRSNFHLPPPRLGQWILDPNGSKHWIAPRAFARSMGFCDSFQLHSDDITAYKQLGNSLSPATALVWLHTGLSCLGVSNYDFALCFRELLFDAIPVNFVSPITHMSLSAPGPHDEGLPAVTAQFHGLHIDLVVLVCQTAARLGLTNAYAALFFRLLRLAAFTHVHIVTSFTCFETFLRRTLQGRTPDACTRSLAFGVWSASTTQETQLTFQLEAVMEEHLHSSTQVGILELAIARFPALSIFTSSHFWASLADAN